MVEEVIHFLEKTLAGFRISAYSLRGPGCTEWVAARIESGGSHRQEPKRPRKDKDATFLR